MVAIDMKMPSCCATCHVSEVDCKHKETAFVRYSRKEFAIPSDCPLVEIVTCKDCKHCRFESVEGMPYYWCDNDDRVTSEDYYCADAERRE